MGEKKQTLGEILISKRLITPDQLNKALRIQTGGNRRLGYILIKMGVISDDQLMESLSDQFDIPIVNIEKEFNKEAKNILPRFICRKYSVMPIAIGDNNVLKLAMVNPLDDEAISNIDSFTNMLIWPMLANQKDISAAISHHVPITARDIYYPFIFSKLARAASIIAIILFIAVGALIQREIKAEKYGTEAHSGNTTIFYNNEIMVAVEGGGAISLIGHGPYAKGFYSVVFNDPPALKKFIDQKKENFSKKQYNWLVWVTDNRLSNAK